MKYGPADINWDEIDKDSRQWFDEILRGEQNEV